MKKIYRVECIHQIMLLKHMLVDLEMEGKAYKMQVVNEEDWIILK